MSYDDFFAMLDAEGAFDSFDYDEEMKKEILGDFLPVLKGSGDPLETHLEDILATAKLKEVRTYPKNEIMYVRVEVRFLTETAEWSRPYQMLAAWDCFNILKGYVFPVGKGTRTRLPIELENTGGNKPPRRSFPTVCSASLTVSGAGSAAAAATTSRVLSRLRPKPTKSNKNSKCSERKNDESSNREVPKSA